MPDYIYICPRGHTTAVNEPMMANAVHICPEEDCGLEMRRKPQTVAVNWGGLKPSDAEQRAPIVQEMIDRDHVKGREEYARYKERYSK